ncbi:bZIP transcription factor 1 [Phytophthora nicotianae]|uniref:BZIP transcription factor 1 n=1 Tax=Phytophthora nicotianae TaxID=4792 RepID=A0A0W8DGA4_PHYNI|nr:bZIP transcription factor 1 [Phytophthora nicotianae]
MSSFVLSPPNSSALSDTVIGAVMQRSTWKTRGKTYDRVDNNATVPNTSHQQSNHRTYRHAPYHKPSQNYPSATMSKVPAEASKNAVLSPSIAELVGQTGLSSGRRRISCLTSDLKTVQSIIASIQGADHSISAELQQAIVAEALKKKIRHRERCRINQARYRQRQMQVETEIEDVIAKIRSEIKELERKSNGTVRPPTTPTGFALASEYFRQFNYYVSSPGTLFKMAFKFLNETMAPDVMGGSFFGVDAQLENWRLFALYFDDVRVDLTGLNTPTSDTLVAGTVTRVTITTNTLCRAFPHLNRDGTGGSKGGVWSPLAAKMLGKSLVMRGSVSFRWDSATDKVVSIYSQADMLTPMLNLLGSLEDVSCAFYKARVTPDCRFVGA